MTEETAIEEAQRRMPEILKESGEARKFWISLQDCHVTQNTAWAMKEHHEFLVTKYTTIKELVANGEEDWQMYADHFSEIDWWSNWYISRSKVAKTDQRHLLGHKPKAGGKQKACAGADVGAGVSAEAGSGSGGVPP